MKTAIDDRLYLEFLYSVNNGEIKQYYDVLGVHPGGYNNPPDDFIDHKTVPTTTYKGHGSFYVRRYQQLREVQLRHGDTKPMWFTEVGWSSTHRVIAGYEYGRDNSEAARGQYVARLLEQIYAEAPYVTGVFLWNLNFRTVVPETDEKYGFGLVNPDFSPTPATPALRTSSRAATALPAPSAGVDQASLRRSRPGPHLQGGDQRPAWASRRRAPAGGRSQAHLHPCQLLHRDDLGGRPVLPQATELRLA